MKLSRSFYCRTDVVKIAQELLGKYLMTNINGVVSGGLIVETEAYAGIYDKASHAYGGRRTSRTEVMYMEGGYSYVYLCYGMHYMFNVVTNVKDIPHAVLIRGINPTDGIPIIIERIKEKNVTHIFNGPGKLTKALGIDKNFNYQDLCGNKIWIEDRGIMVELKKIKTTKRIGIDYAGEDAKLPYRFCLDS